MLKKLIEFCTFKREKLMTDTTSANTTRAAKQLKKQIEAQNETIGKLRERVSTMNDELMLVKTEMSNFQRRVQSDMTEVFEGMKQINQKR
tara:strand:- start:422 stop:691 length:270 start_codon:yes stop_codon:yes gene_type:complete